MEFEVCTEKLMKKLQQQDQKAQEKLLKMKEMNYSSDDDVDVE